MYHKLLERQINKYLKDTNTEEIKGFLDAINSSYMHYERDRVLLEQSMDVHFKEYEEQHQLLEKEIQIREDSVQDLKETLRRLGDKSEEEFYAYIQENDLSSITQLLNKHIAQKRETEKLLKEQNIELKKVNSELDSFVYSASHDLRAPLTSIQGLVGILKISNDQVEKDLCIQYIEESITRLDTFIQNIVDYSRNSRLELKISEVDIDKLISGIFGNFHFMMQDKKITKNLFISKQVPLFSDEMRLTIILNNLISNAIKYIDTEKEKPEITIDVIILKDSVKFIITDNGIRIEKKYIDRIFSMFFRATANNEGAGLGLYIVKEIINSFNGTINLESEFGIGTKFVVEIPNHFKN